MDIEINKKKIRSLRLRVEDGIIKVSAPRSMTDRAIKEFIKNNEEAIERLKREDERRGRYKNQKKFTDESYRRSWMKFFQDTKP